MGPGSEVRRRAGGRLPSTLLPHRTEGLADSFSQGLERCCGVSGSVLLGIQPRLKDFHQLLLSPPKVQALGRRLGAPGATVGQGDVQRATRCVWGDSRVRSGPADPRPPSAQGPSVLSGGTWEWTFCRPQMCLNRVHLRAKLLVSLAAGCPGEALRSAQQLWAALGSRGRGLAAPPPSSASHPSRPPVLLFGTHRHRPGCSLPSSACSLAACPARKQAS